MGRTSPLKAGVITALPVLLVIIIPIISAAPVQETSLSHEKGCFYMNKHHPSGEKIETNEPCLNCTCIGNTLMCYLRVCPFVKPLGESCVSEKHVGDCCPTFWCPQVYPHPTTEKPDTEPRGCYLDGRYYDEGARIPMDPLKPCEVCYCIRNTSVCTMQICELEIDGCFPQYKPGSCCPSRYNCTEQAATTIPPGIMEPEEYEGCRVNGVMYKDGESVPSTDNCETCYCMKHEVVCAVQECTAPADNCVPGEIEEGQCCPTKYECPPTTGISDFLTTFASVEDIGRNVSISEEHATLIPEISTTDLEGGIRPLITMQDAGIKDLHISTVPTDLKPEVSTAAGEITEGLEEVTTATLEAEVSELVTETPSVENATFVTSDLVSRPREPKITEVPEDLFTSVTAPKVTGKPVFFPSRPIPGEGVCRHENKTYQSKEKVPSSDPCRLNCICVNSVVQCEQVECDLTPPESRNNCKIKKLIGECCPKYICDDSDTGEEPTLTTKETPQEVPEELFDEKKTTLDIRDISTDHRLETSLATGGVTEPLGTDTTTGKTISVEDISAETKETASTIAAKEATSISSTSSPLVTQSVEVKPTDLARDKEPELLTTELPVVSTGVSEEQTTETVTDMKVSVTETEAANETVAEAEIDERKRATTPSEEIEITATTKKHISVTPSGKEETTEKTEAEKTEESFSVPSKEFTETSAEAVSITSVGLEKTTPQAEVEQAEKASATSLKDFEFTATTAKPESTTSSAAEFITEKAKHEKTTAAGEEITETTEKTMTLASVGEEKTTQETGVEKIDETSATPIKEMEFMTKTVKPVPSTPSDVHEVTEKGETEATRAGVEFTEAHEKAVSVTSFDVEKTTQEAEIEKAVETSATPIKEFELTTMSGEHVPSTPSDVKKITEKAEAEITTVSAKDFTEAIEKPVSLTSVGVEKTTLEAEIEKAVETSATPIKELEFTVTAGEPVSSTPSDVKKTTEEAEAEITTVSAKDFTEATEKPVSLTSVGVERTTLEAEIEKAVETSATPIKELDFTETAGEPVSSTPSDVKKTTEEAEAEITTVSAKDFTEATEKPVSLTSVGVERTTLEAEIEKAVETSATPIKELDFTVTAGEPVSSTPSDVKKTTEEAEAEITTVSAKDFTEATEKPVSLTSVGVERTTLEAEIEKAVETSATPIKELEFTVTAGEPVSSTPSDVKKTTVEAEAEITTVSAKDFTEATEKPVSLTSVGVERTTLEAEIEKAVETSATPIKELEFTVTAAESVSSTPSDVKKITEKAEAEITTVSAKDFTEATEKPVSLTSVGVERTTLEAEIEKAVETSATPIKELEFTVTAAESVSSTPSDVKKITEKAEAEITTVSAKDFTEATEKHVLLTSVGVERTTLEAEIEKAVETSATPIKEFELTTMSGEHVPSTPSDVKKITEKAEAEITTVSAKDFTEATEKPVSLTSVGVEKTTSEAEIEKAVETSATPIKEFELTTMSGEHVPSTPSDVKKITEKAEAEITTVSAKDFTEATEKPASLTSVGVEKTTQEDDIKKAVETSATPIKEFELTTMSGEHVPSTSSDEHKVTEEEETEATRASVEFTEEPEKAVSSTAVAVEKTTQEAEIEKAGITSATPIQEFELTTTTGEPVSSTRSDVKETTEKTEAEITSVPVKETTEKAISLTSVGVEKTTLEVEIEKAVETSATPLKEFELSSTTSEHVSSTPKTVTESAEVEQTTALEEEFTTAGEKALPQTSVSVEKTTQEPEIEKAVETSATSIKELETVTTSKAVSSTPSDIEEITEMAEAEQTTTPGEELIEATEKSASVSPTGEAKTTGESTIEEVIKTSATPLKEFEFTLTSVKPVSSTPSGEEEIIEKEKAVQTTGTGEFVEEKEKSVTPSSVAVEQTTPQAGVDKASATSVFALEELESTATPVKHVPSTPSGEEEVTEKAEVEVTTVSTEAFSEATDKAVSLTSVDAVKTTQEEAEIEKASETSATTVKESKFTVTSSEPLSSTPSGIEEISEKAEGVKTEETSTGPSREFTEATEEAVSLASVEVDKTTIEAEIEKAGKTSTTIKESEFTVTTGKPVFSTTSGVGEITEKAEAEETTAPGEELTEATQKAVSLTSIGVEKTTQEPEIEKAVETSATPLKELKVTVTTGKAISSTPSGVEEITEKLKEEETSAPGDLRTTPIADKSTEHFTTVSSEISTPVEETDSDIITDHFSVETGSSFDVLDLKKVTETTSFSEGTKTSVAVSDEISSSISTTEIPVSKHVTEKESLTTSSEVYVSEIDEKRESVIPVSEGLPQTTSATGAEGEAKFTTSATTIRATSEKEIEADKKTTERAQSGLADVSMTTALAIENQTVFSTTTSTITMSDTSIKTEFTLTTLPTIKFEDITESVDEALESQTTILVPETVEMGEAELSTSADKITPTDHIERDSKIPVITTEIFESTPEKSETLTEKTITKSTFETSEVTEKVETKELPISKVTSTESTTVKVTPERLPTVESSTSFDLSQVSERDESKTSAETEKEDISPPLRATTFPDVESEISKASDMTTSSEGEEPKATTATSDIKIIDHISTLGADKIDLTIESSTSGIKDVTTDIKFGTSPTEVVEYESSTVTKSSEPEAQTSEKPEGKVSTEHILAKETMTTEPQAETSSLITDITPAKEIDVSEKTVTEKSTVEYDEKISTVAISTKVPKIEKTEGASGITEFGVTPTSTPMKISSEFEGTTAERGAGETETAITDRVTSVTDKSISEVSTEPKLTSIGEETTESTILSDKATPKAITISEKSTPSVTTLISDLSTISEETDVVSDETTKLEITSIEGMKTSESIDIVSITDSQKTTAESEETTGSLEVKDFSDQSVKPDSLLTTKETEHSETPISAITETTEIEQQAEVSEKTTVTTSEIPKITEFKITTSETSKITTESTATKLTTSIQERDEESEGTPSKEVEETTTKKVSEEAEPEELFTQKPMTEEFSLTGTGATFIPSKITLTTSKEDISGDTSKEGETRLATEATEKTPEKLSSTVTTSILSTESTAIPDETLAKQATEPPKVFADEKATTIETSLVSKSLATETPEENITEQKELGEMDTKSTSLLTSSSTDAFSQTDLLESTTMSTTFKPDITTEIQELAKTTVPSTVSLKTPTSTLSTKSEFTEEIVTKLPSETTEGEKFAEITTPAPSELSEKAASTEEVKDSEITTELAATTSKEETSTLATKHGFSEDSVAASKQTEAVKPSEISTVSATEFTPTTFETFDKTTHVKTTGTEAEGVSQVDVASTITVSEVDKEASKITEFSTSGITSTPPESTSGIVLTQLFEKELTTLQGHEAETTTSSRPEKPVSVTGVPPAKETTIPSETTLEAEIGTEAHVTEGKIISDISSTISSSEITTSTPEDITTRGETSVSKETTPAETDAFGEKQKETTGIEAVTKVTSLEEEAATSTVSIDSDKRQLTTKETLEPKIVPSTIETVKTSESTVEPKTSTSTFDLEATTTSETKWFDEKKLSTPTVLDAELSTLKPEQTSESVDLPEKSTVTTLRTLTTESEDLSKTETSIIVEDTIQSNRTFAVDSMVVAHSTTPISESTTEAAEIMKEKTISETTLHDKFDVSEDLLSVTKIITDTPSDLLHVTTQKGLSEAQTFEGSTIKVTTIPEKKASTTEKLEEAFEGQTTLKGEVIQTVSTAVPSTPADKAFSTEIAADIGKVSTESTDVEFPVEKAETGTESSSSEIDHTPVITKEPSSIQAGAETTTFGPITEGREIKTTPSKVTETPQSTEESPLLTAATSVTEKALEAEVTTHAELETPSVSPKKGEEDTTIEAHKETTSHTSLEFETTKEPSTPLPVESVTFEQLSLISKDISEKTTLPEDLFTGKASETSKEITETVPESSSISLKEEAEDHGEFSTVRTEERTSQKSILGTTPSIETFETSTFISLETIQPDLETATPKESEKSPQPETPPSLTEFAASSSEAAISTHATTTSPEKEEATDIESQEGEEKQVETSSILDESLISSTTEAKITSQPPGPVTESTSSTATTTPEAVTEASTHLAGKAGVTALDEIEAKSTTARTSTEDIGEAEVSTLEESDCFINETSYEDGESILTVEPCEKCHCASGQIICFKIVCKIPKRGCVPEAVNADECCPTSYKCPTEGEDTEIVTAGTSSITEKDLSTPIPISFMFSTMPTSISTAILTSKSVVEEKAPAEEVATSTEILSSSTLQIAERTSLASQEHTTFESSVVATASTAGASEGILDISESPSTFKTIEITTESSRFTPTATTSESIPEIKTEKSASEVEPEVTVKEISEIATKSTDEGRIEEFATTVETEKQSTKEETSETAIITETRQTPAVADEEEKITMVSLTTEEKKLTTSISTAGKSTVSEFTSTLADVKAKEFGLEITTVEPSFDVETKSVEPALTGEEGKTTEVSSTTEEKKLEITTPASATSSSTISEFTSTPLTDVKMKEVGLEITTGEPSFDVETKSVEPALTGEEEKTTQVSFTTEGKKLEITTPASTTSSSTVSEFTATPLTDEKAKEFGLEITTGEPSFDVETKSVEPALTDEEEKVTKVSFTTEEKKLKITTPASTTSSSTVSEFTATPLTDEKAKEVGLEIATGEPSFDVETKSAEPALTGEEEKVTRVSFTTEEKKLEITTPASTTSSSTVSEFTATPLTDEKAKEVGLEITTGEPSFDVETKSVEPALTGEEEKVTKVSFTTEEKKLEITTPASTTSSSTVSEFTATPLTDEKAKEVGLEITTGEPSFDVETKSVEPALTGEEEKVTKVSLTTEEKKLEITTPASTTSSSTVSEFTSTPLTGVKVKEVGLEVTTGEPSFDVETKSVEPALTGEEERVTEVSFTTEGKKLEITTPASTTSSSTVSEFTSTPHADEEVKDVGLEIITEKPFFDVKTIPTETSLAEAEVTTLEETVSTPPKPIVTEEHKTPEELKFVTDQITTIAKDDLKPISTTEISETSSSSSSSISDERGAETTTSGKLFTVTKEQPSGMITKSEVDKFTDTEPTVTDRISSEEKSTGIVHDVTESTVFTSESGEISSVDITEMEAKSTATTLESKLSSISFESTVESRGAETTLSVESSATTKAPASDVTSKFEVTDEFKDTEATKKETSLPVEELSTKERTTPTTEIKSTSESTESSVTELMADKITKAPSIASEETKAEGTPFPESSMPTISSVSPAFTTEERITETEELGISSKETTVELETKSAETEKSKDFQTTTTAKISAEEEVRTKSELAIGVTEQTPLTTEVADISVTASKAEAELKAETTLESGTSTISSLSSISTSPEKRTEVTGEAEMQSTEKTLSEITTKSAEAEKVTQESAFTEKISTFEPGKKTTVTSEAEEVTEAVLSELTTKSEKVEKATLATAFTEKISTLKPGEKTTAISEESTVSHKGTEIAGEAEVEVTESVLSELTTKSEEVEKVTQKTAFTESIPTLEPGKKTTESSEEKDKPLSTVEADKVTTMPAVSAKEDELKVTTVVPEAVTSPTITVTSKFISDSLITSETKEFDLTTFTEAAEIQKETQKVEEVESTIKTTGALDTEKLSHSTTLKPEETTKILEVTSSTSLPAKLPKLEDSITSTARIPVDKSTSTEKVEMTISTLKVEDIDIVTEEKHIPEDQATTMHAEYTSEESVTVASTEFKPAKFTTSVTEAPGFFAETSTSTSGEDLSDIEAKITDGAKFPSDISLELTTLSETISTEVTINDTALFKTERPSPSLTSRLETLGVEDLKTTVTPLIITSVKIQTDHSLGKVLTEGEMMAKEESTITTKATESSESTSNISFQKTDVTKAFKAVPETTEKPFTTSTLKPTEPKDAEKDLIDTADKVKSTDIGSTEFTIAEERSTKPILETTTSPDKTTFSQEDEFSESLESFTETILTNQTVISLSKESTPFFEDEHTVSPSDVEPDVSEKEVPSHLPQTSTTEGVQEGETTLQPKTTVTLDQTKTADEIFKFVSTRFTEFAKETKSTTEGLFTEVALSSTTSEPPITPKEVFTTKGPAIKALDVEISTHLPFEIKTTPKELEISETDELATRTSTEQAPSSGLTAEMSDLFTAKEELSTLETQTKLPELEMLTEMTGETKDTSKPPIDQTLSPEIVSGVKQEDVTSSTQTSLPPVTSTVSDKVDVVAEEEMVTERHLKISSLVTEQSVPSTEGIEKVTEARELTGISAEGVSTITETELFTKSTSLPEETSKLFEVSRITTSEKHAAETTTEAKEEEHLLTTLEPRQPEAEMSSQTTPGRSITTLSSIETEPSVSTKSPPFTTSVDFKFDTLPTVKVPSMTDETDIEAKIASLTPLIKLDLTSTISSLITSTVEELSPSVKDQKTTTSVPEEAIITKESDIVPTEISLSAEATSSPIIQPEVGKETIPSDESKTESGIEVSSTTRAAITEHEQLENITESQAESDTETSPKSVTESVPEVSESFTQTPKESSTLEVSEELSTKKIITLAAEEIEAQTTQESLGPFSPRRPAVPPTDEMPTAKDLESSTQKITEPPVQKSTELPTKGFKGIETTPLPLMTTLAAAIENGTTPIDEDFLLDEGACIFEGQIYQSAEQIVRADPCEFCFCFRGDIICLQQSCPPPAPNCHRTMIHGYCCPRYDCPVLVTSRNISALQRRKGQVQPIIIQRRIEKRAIERAPVEVKGCQIGGTFYEFGQTVAKSSGPCLHCLCENGGNMRCDPLKCRPQKPLLMKMNKPFFETRR